MGEQVLLLVQDQLEPNDRNPLGQDQALVLYQGQDPALFQDPNPGLYLDHAPVRDLDQNPGLCQGPDPAQDLDQNPARFPEPDPVEQDLDQNHALLPCPEPVLDPGQNQGQNQDLVQSRRNWVVRVFMTLVR